MPSSIQPLFDLLTHLPTNYEEYEKVINEAETLAKSIDKQALKPYIADLSHQMIHHPNPYQRATIGRVLGILDLDHRHGLGLNEAGLPAIDWVEIPEGEFIYQQDTKLTLPTYYISRYHTTYRQFQAFLEAEDGFGDGGWWDGFAEKKERFQIQQTPPQQIFRFWNHPIDDACWYDAMAFCRWWSYRLGGAYEIDRLQDWLIRLPTEQEWEKAARGTDGRKFTWGNDFHEGYVNFDETDRYDIQQAKGKVGTHFYGAPTAGGLFPQGASPYGVMDMLGTMWDLTLTEYRHGKNDDLLDYYPRVIRGGTWFTTEMYCNIVERVMLNPHARNNGDPRKNDYGFRVMSKTPIK
ncbi:MAG: SUMF1/EgtB/PvdO family nonheme iron enzyme [bacterium]|nr:SUMF1/EgtB/PvdO family nonheme iron enzyme [bacterium]